MSLQYTYCTGYSTNIRGELWSNSFFFFFLVADLEDKSACQIKESLFWGCPADTMQHPGQERSKVALEGIGGTRDPG